MITRRDFTMATGTMMLNAIMTDAHANDLSNTRSQFVAEIAKIEADVQGRLGVALLDTSAGVSVGYRENELFPLCSTFKVLAAGAVLKQCDVGKLRLDSRVQFAVDDLVPNSPITKQRTGGDGMTLAELCAAAIDYSDNTAGNLLLGQIDGPAGLTKYARSLGDTVTRLDRNEVALNEAIPGDPRDTTTPGAMLSNLKQLLLGSALSAGSRTQLVDWMRANTTGGARLKAGFPADWPLGDKTGSGERGSTNDIAIIWPTDRRPVLLTSYLTDTADPADRRNAAIAAVGRLATAFIKAA